MEGNFKVNGPRFLTLFDALLKSRKLRGLESKGMILFADNEVNGKIRYEFVSTEAEDGNPVA